MEDLVECESSGQKLNIAVHPCFENRGTAVAKLLLGAYELSEKKDFQFCVSTTDRPNFLENIKTYNFSTVTDDFSATVPDFLFDCWKQCDIEDYDIFCNKISEWGSFTPMSNSVGWVGANTSEVRSMMLNNYARSDYYRTHCQFFVAEKRYGNFMSFEEQVRRWRFMFDAEGIGWSARVKLLFFSKRVVFLVDRPYKEFYYQHLEPWKHYVPVARDLSDFEQNLNRVLGDYDLEKSLIGNAYEFAQNHLTRKCALEYLAKIMNSSS